MNYPDLSIFHRCGVCAMTDVSSAAIRAHCIGIRAWISPSGRWPELAHRVPQVDLHIYGRGPEKENLAALANQLGLANRVFLRDTVSLRETARIMENEILRSYRNAPN